MAKISITQAELANLAGVSRKTVYRALHAKTKSRIRLDVQQKIQTLARQYNYRPNLAAQTMVTGRHHNIAILTSQWHPAEEDEPDPLYPVHDESYGHQGYLVGINDVLAEEGYCLSISFINSLAERQTIPQSFDQLRFDAAIALGTELSDPLQQRLMELSLPCVYVNTTKRLPSNCVTVEDFEGARMLTRYMIEKGHRNIAFLHSIREASRYLYSIDRTQGYLDAMKEHGLTPHPAVSFYARREERYAWWETLLKDPDHCPTAFLPENPSLASVFYLFARDRGLLPGREYALASFDNVPVFNFLDPPLTALELPSYPMGRAAACMALRLVETPNQPQPSQSFRPELIERKSVPPMNEINPRRAK